MARKLISVCITTFNESEETINKLLKALDSQTLKADEVIIVDATEYRLPRRIASRNDTASNYKLISRTGVSRAEGRNIAIKKAKNEIIAITDAGCTPHKDWLEKLVKPFKIATASPRNDTMINRNDIVVAGGYRMVAHNSFEKAEAIFLGVSSKNIKEDFLPSARSMAFTKTIWKKAGGFPENLDDTAEDTVFNLNLLRSGAKFVAAKNAVVDWYMPTTIKSFYLKIKNYAKGDAQSSVWWHPIKKYKTHNIKVLTIFARYILALVLLRFGYWYLFVFIGIYSIWAFMKAGWWGIILQFTSDFAAMFGFVSGIRLLRFARNDRSGRI